jgi:formylglycine-generating enzyme required for sulfatase activity
MTGNVREWTWDTPFDSYQRYAHGGSSYDGNIECKIDAYCYFTRADVQSYCIGFRIVRTVTE